MISLLPNIHIPADLKKLSCDQLKQLAAEVRAFMVETIAETGGHLASSLGAVELTIALHFVLQTPEDRIVWDVGHQTYAHKILTQRQDLFHTLRQMGGISGFPRREESPYDTFNTGHSSTSISAALGMARARDLAGKTNRVVAVIGDGSLSNGMALEALNDAGHKKTDLLVVLNDNSMSISPAIGGLSNYLNQIITGRIYNRLKPQIDRLLSSIPAVGPRALHLANYLEEIAKGLIVPGILFEELGFRYFGPVDGHDLEQLLVTLQRLQQLTGPILLHVKTVKGKGFEHAEKNPIAFHGAPKFDVETGAPKSCLPTTYTQIFSQHLLDLARENKKIVAIVAAMATGTGLEKFSQELPGQFFDVGIAEEHAVTLAAGMAAEGFQPVVIIYSTFLQRAYDQILHDVCLQNLPVVFALDRAGLVGEDGPTHHGVFDLAYLRPMPHMAIFAPSQEEELKRMLAFALQRKGPTAIRYPRGCIPTYAWPVRKNPAPLTQAQVWREGQDGVILGLGNMLVPALQAAQALSQQGIQMAVLDPRCIKPLDAGSIIDWAKKTGRVVTVEDHVLSAGFGSAVLELLQQHSLLNVPVTMIGLPDRFIEHGAQEALQHKYQLDDQGIKEKILQAFAGPKPRHARTSASSRHKRSK